MNTLLKDVFGVFKFAEGLYAGIRKLLVPPKAYSWQTFIYMSVFSWVLSYFATGYIKDIIAFFGWLFLIAGTAWYTTEDPLRVPGTFMPVGAVITGFLVSVFAFGDQRDVITPRTIVFWPTISALITAIPEFIEGNDTDAKARIPKPQDRQKIIILVASSMLLSCWIQFHFVTDNWLRQYPSLQADTFKNSTFIVRTEQAVKIPRNGVVILQRLQPIVVEQIAERPWSEVEKWLLDAKERVGNLGREIIKKNLSKYEEKELWRVEPRVANTKSGYILDLLSIWIGPSSNPRGYYLKKSCRIEPVAETTNSENKITVAEIECDRASKLIPGSPPPQQ
ncbi:MULTISPECIES: septal junction protein FraD [unclassified Nostoc]|uniref:septal junction protein FraD n=1 Tax=unclassified Nostoc TaxID=2593658 RepID=UPI0025AAF6F9|nr:MULTISPECIES: septal junction protein FraD [unclassified Nostoc]MDM9584462.1 septal junction protein FraD [Nostoc sp. GT001]MDZ7945605.1 septal junction protein FraD [Nostoc sp. EfeVER01]MDZ7993092.1 septal junction protein FraD [Nostoc sp. EspVER01]